METFGRGVASADLKNGETSKVNFETQQAADQGRRFPAWIAGTDNRGRLGALLRPLDIQQGRDLSVDYEKRLEEHGCDGGVK